jgi:threonine/homoserine/homoserine lactone efflux protein
VGINFAAFLGVSLFVILSPGPDTALTIRNTLVGGRGGGIATALGVVSGLATWTVASSAGLAALLVASQPLFLAVRLAGAGYLVFLGLQALRAAFFTKGDLRQLAVARTSSRLKRNVAYRQGLLSNLSNPKIVVFFLSLLPQFIDRGQASFERLLLLGLIFCAITVTWLTLYAVVVARVGDFLRRDRGDAVWRDRRCTVPDRCDKVRPGCSAFGRPRVRPAFFSLEQGRCVPFGVREEENGNAKRHRKENRFRPRIWVHRRRRW